MMSLHPPPLLLCSTWFVIMLHDAACAVTHVARDPASLVRAVRATLHAWPASHTLLFAVSKSVPRPAMAEIIDGFTTRTHVGALTEPLPAPWPHSVAIAAFPHARPFYSSITGAPRIAVGRWTAQKEVWRADPHERTDRLDAAGHWAPLWGRTNIEHRLPAPLQHANDIHSLLVLSDAYPEGLLEGLDYHFPHATLVGATAAFTPFETGREHTLLHQGIYERGAVGIALPTPSILHRTLHQLCPRGPRLCITGARGNIISSLDGHNAAQQMVRIVSGQGTAHGPSITDPQRVRSMSSRVRKDDAFFLGIYATHTDTMPLSIARIPSGHPMRGTICIDTNVDIVPNTYAQIFQPGDGPVVADAPAHARTTYTIASGSAIAHTLKHLAPQSTTAGVRSYPDTFLVASEHGWFGRPAAQPTRAYTVPHTGATLGCPPYDSS